MKEEKSLFNKIATIYNLFFNRQVKSYRRYFDAVKSEDLDLSTYQSVIDIGCGTGALCKVLHEHGLKVTGLDPAEAMLKLAEKRMGRPSLNKPNIDFVFGNVLKGLPFEDNHFDIAITSYVAHGLMLDERQVLYKEMQRVAKHMAVFIDYNDRRSLLTDVAEWLEGGDYFAYIKNNKEELMKQFGNLKVVNTGKHGAIYICKIN